MHKITEKEFTMADFSCEHLLSLRSKDDERTVPIIDVSPYYDKTITYSPNGWFTDTIYLLNECRKWYLETNDKKYWWQIIQLLPSSYNQTRNFMLNYEVLANMYKSRTFRRPDRRRYSFRTSCEKDKNRNIPRRIFSAEPRKLIEDLPYSDLITGEEKEMLK